MSDSDANVVFLPWIRQGAAAAIANEESLGELPGAATLAAALTVNGTESVGVTVRLLGPGDVTGIGALDIVRREPPPNSVAFEPNHFVAVEFDRPDFPWLFTPAKADASARLRPWLCLAVVRKQDGVVLHPGTSESLPSLEIGAPAQPGDELPDLAECWLWAHGQVAASGGADVAALKSTLAGDSSLSLSRLIAPRLLQPDSEYFACLVPTFEAGRKAGLGLPVDAAETLLPAWSSGSHAATATRLPLYDYWSFRTGAGGDFKSLAKLLRAHPAPDTLGKRPVNIGAPGFKLPASFPEPASLALEGALKPLKAGDALEWPAGAQEAFQATLAAIVNAGHSTSANADPLLAPPLYGRWHAGRDSAQRTAPNLTWFDELNLDPRHRAVSAFGTQVVQENQEALMSSAWQQAGAVRAANQRMRQLQLSLMVGESLHARHVQRLDQSSLLRMASPALTRMSAAAANSPQQPTLATQFLQAALPLQALAPPMRKLARAAGPVNRRVLSVAGSNPGLSSFLTRINVSEAVVASPPGPSLVTFGALRGQAAFSSILTYAQVTQEAVLARPGAPQFQIEPEGTPLPQPVTGVTIPAVDNACAAAFRAAASAHLAALKPNRPWILVFRPLHVVDLGDLHTQLLAQMQPRAQLKALAAALVPTGGNLAADDAVPVTTVRSAPRFPQPMYAALRDLSQDLLLPGLNAVEQNAAIGLKTNRRFVEAYLVGLNTEMGRELLWRGYPTDQRGTYFDRFWDRAGTEQPQADIDPIHLWGGRALGAGGGTEEQFVILLRTELLRRYPTAVIYAAPAVQANGRLVPDPVVANEQHPAFRDSLPPDVTFIGFDLNVREAVGGPGAGYFIIIQEQAAEPHFGMDEGLVPTTGTYLRAAGGAPPGLPLRGLPWGRNAAHMAGILRRVPVRIAIHASQFIAPGDLP